MQASAIAVISSEARLVPNISSAREGLAVTTLQRRPGAARRPRRPCAAAAAPARPRAATSATAAASSSSTSSVEVVGPPRSRCGAASGRAAAPPAATSTLQIEAANASSAVAMAATDGPSPYRRRNEVFSASRPAVAEIARPTVLIAYCSCTSGHSGSRVGTADIVDTGVDRRGALGDDQADRHPGPRRRCCQVSSTVSQSRPTSVSSRSAYAATRISAVWSRSRHLTRTIGAGGGAATPVRSVIVAETAGIAVLHAVVAAQRPGEHRPLEVGLRGGDWRRCRGRRGRRRRPSRRPTRGGLGDQQDRHLTGPLGRGRGDPALGEVDEHHGPVRGRADPVRG